MLRTQNLNRYRAIYAVLAGALLALPLVAMQVTDDVDWSSTDFIAAALLLLGMGIGIELAVRLAPSRVMRACGVALSILTIVFVWGLLATA